MTGRAKSKRAILLIWGHGSTHTTKETGEDRKVLHIRSRRESVTHLSQDSPRCLPLHGFGGVFFCWLCTGIGDLG